MKTSRQAGIAQRLFAHIDERSTDRAEQEMTISEADYLDADRAVRERDLITRSQACVVAVSDELPEPGCFVTVDLLGTNVLIVRQEDGSLRAFRNVCRHRCSTVVGDDQGQQRAFSCPYHGWTYALDGALRALPDHRDSFPSVDLSERGLVQLPVHERHGLVWVCASAEANLDFSAHFGSELDDELHDLDLPSYRLLRKETFDQPVNWKLIMDGFLEVYHVRFLHPTSVGKITMSNVLLLDVLGEHLRVVSPRKDIEQLRPTNGDQPDILPGVILTYALMPNTVLVHVRDHIELWTILPHETAADRCRVTLSFLVPELPDDENSRAYWDRNWDTVIAAVQDEDWAAARRIQRNLDPSSAREMILGRNELALHHFHRYLDEALTRG